MLAREGFTLRGELRRALIAVGLALVFAVPAAAQPNVLLIVTDDQRWDTLGYMPTVSTELVGNGVTFENSFVVNPVCCPSRASILTGQWSHTHGVWGIAGTYGGFHRFDDASTLATWLHAAGYRTGLFGKYLNGYRSPDYVPPGWDEWFAFTLNPNAYFDYGVTERSAAPPRGTRNLWFGSEPEDYATDVLAERAVDFIRSSGPEPFFLYFSPKAPHIGGPMQDVTPAPRHVGRLDGLEPWRPPSLNEHDVSDKPEYVRLHAKIPRDELDPWRQRQLESLLAVDEAIAHMVAALQEAGKLADTLIVFTSDNGFGWGEHRRTHKIVPYEESIRVPFIIRYDRLGIPPRAEGRLALNVDLAPTVAAAAGIASPGAEGRDLFPMISGPSSWRASFLFEAYMQGWRVPAYCAFRGQSHKYVQYATGEEELYDLARDPYELTSQHRTIQRTLLMAYRKRVQRSACRPPGFRPLRLCTRIGTARADWIHGTRRWDWICAGAGPDRIDVRAGSRDVVRCGAGFDRVRADLRDRLIGCERRL
jgi:N-acetylglucosamine-6-sulfatase